MTEVETFPKPTTAVSILQDVLEQEQQCVDGCEAQAKQYEQLAAERKWAAEQRRATIKHLQRAIKRLQADASPAPSPQPPLVLDPEKFLGKTQVIAPALETGIAG